MPTETATTITMPKLGESVTEGTIGTWLKQVGDRVDKYEPLLEVDSDKVNTEVPSPVAGVLVEILVEPATTVPVGTGLCRIDESGTGLLEPETKETAATNGNLTANGSGVGQDTAASSASVRRPGEIADEMDLLRVRSSPVVRRIAEEHSVDIAQIEGSGIGGRVTRQDILAYLAQMEPVTQMARVGDEVIAEASVVEALEEAAGAPPRPVPAAEQPAAWAPPAAAPAPPAGPAREQDEQQAPRRTPVTVYPGDEVVPVSPMRRNIAEHMVRSERTAPHVTVVMEVDMTNVVAYRAARKEEFRRREGIELTYLPFAIKATTLALRDHPRLNAVWDEERIVQRGAINVGVAVALEDGLIVPVIKHADRLSIAGLTHAVSELAGKARAGTLGPDDVAGGTFTINNPGTFGSLVSTPILVQPQAAILSTEAIIKRPVVVEDMIGIRSMMNLSLSIDHRVLDGLAAARFLQQVKGWLEGVDDSLPLF